MNTFYKISPVIAVLGLLLLSGCDDYTSYDKGYESAWEEEDEPDFFASQDEKDGYEDGEEDLWLYAEGYDDGVNSNRPEYFDDEFYMEGYTDGRQAR